MREALLNISKQQPLRSSTDTEVGRQAF